MQHYSGSYYCTKSIWDGKLYDCNNMVVIDMLDEGFGIEDSKKLLGNKKFFNQSKWDHLESYYKEKNKYSAELMESAKELCQSDCYFLTPEVLKWLDENILDDQSGKKGWCCGNDDYNSSCFEGFNIFFYRRKDALNFIRTWSVFKKPTQTYSQSTYVMKKLDLKTNKLVPQERD